MVQVHGYCARREVQAYRDSGERVQAGVVGYDSRRHIAHLHEVSCLVHYSNPLEAPLAALTGFHDDSIRNLYLQFPNVCGSSWFRTFRF